MSSATATLANIIQTIADELTVGKHQVNAAIELLDEGATVPFISRYRKEVTGGLDDSQLRTLQERLGYLRELEERRVTILKSIDEQGKLTPELKGSILGADTKTRLEDLYLPYKPKRRTKGQIATEAGLEPLADALFNDATLNPETEAASYLNAEHKIDDCKAALDGAKFILMERFSENAELLGQLRDYMLNNAVFNSTVAPGKEQEGSKFSDYFEHSEVVKKIPSHRALAMFRGRREGFLHIKVDLIQPEGATATTKHLCEVRIANPLWHRRPGPRRRQMAGRGSALDLAGQTALPYRNRPAG